MHSGLVQDFLGAPPARLTVCCVPVGVVTRRILFLVVFFINSKCLIIWRMVSGRSVASAVFHSFCIEEIRAKYLLPIFISIVAWK